MNKKTTLFTVVTIFVISLALALAGCSEEPKQVDATSFTIDAEKALIADRNGNIELNLAVEPDDAFPLDINFESSDANVATATIGAIDDNGNVVTAAELQAEKDELAKKDEEAAEKILVPTNTAIVTANDYGECTITGTLGTLSDDVRIIVADKQIALTFDDGAAPPTATLIDGLEKEDVHATFFVVGEMSKRDDSHIESLKREIKDGFEIGNHTYNHIVGTTNIASELQKTDDLLVSLGGEKTTIMRPPGGAVNSAIRNCGKAIIQWSCDTMDWKYRDPVRVKNAILKADDGDIVLIHDLHETSVEGALQAIPELKKKGVYMATVTELLGDPQPNKEYRKGEPGKLITQILD